MWLVVANFLYKINNTLYTADNRAELGLIPHDTHISKHVLSCALSQPLLAVSMEFKKKMLFMRGVKVTHQEQVRKPASGKTYAGKKDQCVSFTPEAKLKL